MMRPSPSPARSVSLWLIRTSATSFVWSVIPIRQPQPSNHVPQQHPAYFILLSSHCLASRSFPLFRKRLEIASRLLLPRSCDRLCLHLRP
ncbi:unnamed protein product [Periconia digitata]|uniref:Uncharacterized protein n=1 Tax=Periconia digitata TaxID=1303443 RepID=A0A9W4USY5_9PLEO|nr:unnamed protein product [Periconia digitata]